MTLIKFSGCFEVAIAQLVRQEVLCSSPSCDRYHVPFNFMHLHLFRAFNESYLYSLVRWLNTNSFNQNYSSKRMSLLFYGWKITRKLHFSHTTLVSFTHNRIPLSSYGHIKESESLDHTTSSWSSFVKFPSIFSSYYVLQTILYLRISSKYPNHTCEIITMEDNILLNKSNHFVAWHCTEMKKYLSLIK